MNAASGLRPHGSGERDAEQSAQDRNGAGVAPEKFMARMAMPQVHAIALSEKGRRRIRGAGPVLYSEGPTVR